ncbi:ATP-dependent DNA/RNA helicase DHX36 [Nematolebias whitei]|uniref:ATP-dependent DNA/RNA helicase DHX36 n=1 Tax=Nematolebias whitei TaxID=451745 RepID=UPI0018984EBC|nr:ATP-dependent DNA/RNA helicase DHX36 [Nematolebias whitei]
MSYGYGGGGGGRGRRGGRGHRDGSRERMDRDAGVGGGSRGHSSSSFDQDRGGGGGQKDRPPPHLRGREIGLWYARYGAVRRKQADRRSRAVVHMDEAREEHITKLLNSVQNDQSGPRRDRRNASDNWQTAANHSGHCYFDGDLPEEEKHKAEVESEEEEEDVTTPGQKKTSHRSQRGVSKAAVKDEPPDNWDEEDQEEKKEEKPLRKDKDLEFLFQEVVRDRSMDEDLKRDLHSKASDPKYKEMLTATDLLFMSSRIQLNNSAVQNVPSAAEKSGNNPVVIICS